MNEERESKQPPYNPNNPQEAETFWWAYNLLGLIPGVSMDELDTALENLRLQYKDDAEMLKSLELAKAFVVWKESESWSRKNKMTEAKVATMPPQPMGWQRVKYFVASLILLFLGVAWVFEITLENGSDDAWGLILAVMFGLWGSALLARVFGKTLFGIIKDFFRLKAVKTTNWVIKKLLKFAIWLGLVIFVIWLIVALGPLWIISIILLLILFVVANK